MAVPDPPAGPHKLIACTNRYGHQLKRTANYLNAIIPALVTDTQKGGMNLEFCLETIVLMLYAFLEEFYRSLISLVTFLDPERVRIYMAKRIPSEALTYEAMPASELCRNVAQRFSFSSKKLENFKELFKELFGIEPFPDQASELMIHDLAVVRHIITHQGGWPDTNNVETINRPDVLVTSNELGIFLRIDMSFITDVLKALQGTAESIEASILKNPRFTL